MAYTDRTEYKSPWDNINKMTGEPNKTVEVSAEVPDYFDYRKAIDVVDRGANKFGISSSDDSLTEIHSLEAAANSCGTSITVNATTMQFEFHAVKFSTEDITILEQLLMDLAWSNNLGLKRIRQNGLKTKQKSITVSPKVKS